jgi:hypothetical protein
MSKRGDKRREEQQAKREKQRERLVKTEFAPQLGKSPKAAQFKPEDDGLDVTVLWSFTHFDGHDWRKHSSDSHSSFCDVSDKLKAYSQRKWRDILSDVDRDHPAVPSQLDPEAQQRLIDLGHTDIDELFRFRFTGTQRLWGFRDRAFFIVLWWDPDHMVWPMAKE